MGQSIKLDIDEEKAAKPLGIREWVGCVLLLTVFNIVFPARYGHQLDALWDSLNEARRK